MQAKPSWGAAVAVMCLVTMMASVPQGARAEVVIENILENGTQVGSLSFPAFSGMNASGVDFSYSGFTQDNITSISYTVDPSTLDVTALDLNALQGDNPCPNDSMDCSNSTLTLTSTGAPTGEAQFGSTSCSFSDDMGECSASRGLASITFQGILPAPAPVPEPSTFALAASGLLGLSLIRRRKLS